MTSPTASPLGVSEYLSPDDISLHPSLPKNASPLGVSNCLSSRPPLFACAAASCL